ncbi:MAG: GAF domain-containing protein [Acidimicrobiales bacterium]
MTDNPTAEVRAVDLVWSDLLRKVIAIAGEEHELRSVLRRVAELVAAATDADACFVHVLDHEAGEVVLMGATPAEFDELAGTIRLPIGDGIAGWVAQRGRPAVVDDKWTDPRYRYIPALRGEDFSSMVSVPLLRPQGIVVGVLNLHARQADHFAADSVAHLEEVASLLAGIVEGAVLHSKLLVREDDLERFAIRTIELQELDRRRIAGDIHDGISQRLVSAWYHLRAAATLTTEDEVRLELAAVDTLLSDALAEAHGAISGLRPTVLDDLGLTAAISSLAADVGGLEVDVDLEECALPSHVETAVYRIAQEALQNTMKHAGATALAVSLHTIDGRVTLTISDDGLGFDAATPAGSTSYGLSGMHERAGLLGATLQVRSRAGEGTVVTLELPPIGSAS